MEENSHHKHLLHLSKQAGEIIRANFASLMPKEWKNNNTPLTETDLQISRLATVFLTTYFPDYSILSEEEEEPRQKNKFLWVCDPLDGTLAYSHGIPLCTFSVALVCKGKVQLGCIYEPFLDLFYYAEKGKGASLNQLPLSVAPITSLTGKVVGIAGGHNSTLNMGLLHNTLKKQDTKVIITPSILYVTALVASGAFAATIFGGDCAHDAAAAKIIVEEAGGIVTDLQGKDQAYNKKIYGFVASSKSLHPHLLEMLKGDILLPQE